jgi:hypothetical protein
MERRFGTSFAKVRVHTGPAAASLCALLQARALTLGRDIAFADGQYAPDSADGRLLLAHELVHVLQQRAAIPRTPSWLVLSSRVAIGDPLDNCEREADRLAASALGAGLRSAVTPDGSGAIRRAITIGDPTADITANYKNAKPGIDYFQRGTTDSTRFAVLHLTVGSGPIIRGEAVATPAKVSAIRLTGTVLVQAEPKDDVSANWRFHFIQLFYDKLKEASYAGRTPADGSMTLNFVGPTYYNDGCGKFLQDSDPNSKPLSPYSDSYTPQLAVIGYPPGYLWKPTVTLDDHPHADLPLMLENFVTKRVNYLYRVRREYDVVTALVATDMNSNTIRTLAYLGWGARYDAGLHWHVNPDGTTVVDPAKLTTADFPVDKAATKGAHPDSTLAKMIANPHTDPDRMYNKAVKDAFDAVLGGKANNSDIAMSKSWTPVLRGAPTVPANHFK